MISKEEQQYIDSLPDWLKERARDELMSYMMERMEDFLNFLRNRDWRLALARAAVIEVASEDEYWKPQDEELVFVEPTDDPNHFMFSVSGMATDYGCVRVQHVNAQDGKADVFYHDEDTIAACEVCGWKAGS